MSLKRMGVKIGYRVRIVGVNDMETNFLKIVFILGSIFVFVLVCGLGLLDKSDTNHFL